MKPGLQAQTGEWSTTRQSEFGPQVPGQGSMHFWLTQPRLAGQSEAEMHSGRQLGAIPIMPVRQEHWGELCTGSHRALGPQGCDWQGFSGNGGKTPSTAVGGGIAAKIINSSILFYSQVFQIKKYNFLLGIIWHPRTLYGSPVQPTGQAQNGMCPATEHWARLPHIPGQGSTQRRLMQDRPLGHSALERHSGLHPSSPKPV